MSGPLQVRPWTPQFVVVGVAAAIAVLTAIALVQSNASDPGASQAAEPDGPVVATARDASFGLTLSTPQGTYRPGERIEPVASVTYLGPKAIETIYHASEPIHFMIAEVGGQRSMGGAFDMPCLSTALANGASVTTAFVKSGMPTDDPTVGFDLAWYQDRELRLPPGVWRVIARLDISTGDCGGPAHPLTAENVIRVVEQE